MAITIPADLELFELNQLLGLIPAGQDPVHTLMRRVNWHYATHAPPLVDIAPDHVPAATVEVIVPCYPSADYLTYDSVWQLYAAAAGTVDIDIQEATTYGGVYTSLATYPHTVPDWGGGNTQFTRNAQVATTTRFLKIRCLNGAGNVQVQGLTLSPQKLTSIAAAAKPSGMVPYEDAALTATGAPIHTEYWLRAQDSIRGTYSDRRQVLWSWCQTVAAPRIAIVASAQWTTQRFALAGCQLPVSSKTLLTVYAKCADSGGGAGTVLVGQVGSSYEPAKITADDTAGSDTFYWDPHGEDAIYAVADNPSGTMTPRYVIVEWTPSIGSSIPLIGSPAPPPLHEYLISLDKLTREACLRSYAATGKAFSAANAGLTYWYCGLQIGPGLKALRPVLTVSRSNATSAGTSAEFWTTDSGAGANDKILVESPLSGPLTYPPSLYAQVVPGCEEWDDTPAVAMARLCEVTADREPKYQAVWGRYYCGWSYRPLPFWPETDLP